MAYTGETLKKMYHILEAMPDRIYFDTEDTMSFQANTNEKARLIKSFFPGVEWTRTYMADQCDWWEWSGVFEGVKIRIYAIHEAPSEKCEAIYETRIITKKVPIAYKEVEVEERVIVSWDCGEGD